MSNGQREHLSWEHFRESVRAGLPTIHRIMGDPPCDMFVDEEGRRIGLRIPVSGADHVEPSEFRAIDFEIVKVGRSPYLEVATKIRELFSEFFVLMTSVIDSVQLDHVRPIEATLRSLESLQDLVRRVSILSPERQEGLWGELWLLHRLMGALGDKACEAWTGPQGEQHDFRIREEEFEVKTTESTRRTHIINGLRQLVPSPEHVLFLVSLQVEPAGFGSGLTLPEQVARIRHRLESSRRFDSLLGDAGYRDEDASYYTATYQLRSTPMLIPIDSNFPAITQDLLLSAIPEHLGRIDEVRYRVDVEGFGYPDGSVEFLDRFPPEEHNR